MKIPISAVKSHLLSEHLKNNGASPKYDNNSLSRGGSIGIKINQHLQIPNLNNQNISILDSSHETLITRHFPEKYLSSALGGYFRFGTISGYKPADALQIGRFSDVQEGTQRESFRNRTGQYRMLKLGGNTFSNINLHGCHQDIVIEYQINDYCSCSSKGNFTLERAEKIRNRGNPDIGAYIVYDVFKLRCAIMEILSENKITKNFSIIGRDVIYGKKDRHWEIEDHFSHVNDRDPLAIWLGTAFVKSVDYIHEEEFRMLLFKSNKIGALHESELALELDDRRIAHSIVSHGKF